MIRKRMEFVPKTSIKNLSDSIRLLQDGGKDVRGRQIFIFLGRTRTSKTRTRTETRTFEDNIFFKLENEDVLEIARTVILKSGL